MLLLNFLILIIFSFIAVQDFRQREVSWYLFPLAFAVVVARALFLLDFKVLMGYFGINLLFIVMQIAILFLLYAIKNKRFVNIINSYIGLGDVLFFILICAGFAPLIFTLYFISSLILLTIVYSLIRLVRKNLSKDIPLAGGLSVSYILIFVVGIFSSGFSVYNDLVVGDFFFGK